jgi:hypothetical protein
MRAEQLKIEQFYSYETLRWADIELLRNPHYAYT